MLRERTALPTPIQSGDTGLVESCRLSVPFICKDVQQGALQCMQSCIGVPAVWKKPEIHLSLFVGLLEHRGTSEVVKTLMEVNELMSE